MDEREARIDAGVSIGDVTSSGTGVTGEGVGADLGGTTGERGTGGGTGSPAGLAGGGATGSDLGGGLTGGDPGGGGDLSGGDELLGEREVEQP